MKNIVEKDNFNKNKLFHDNIIRHKNKIFNNEKGQQLFFYNILIRKIYITTI